MKKYAWVLFFGVILMAACRPSPEAIVREQVAAHYSETAVSTFLVRGVRQTESGVIVLYTMENVSVPDEADPQQDEQFLGFAVLEAGPWGWRRGMDGGMGRYVGNGVGETAVFFDYAAPPAVSSDIDHGILYGEILSSNVATIELLLANGETLTDDGSGNTFAFYIPATTSAKELRVLDANNGLLMHQPVVTH